jgi:hypothetical protein
MRSLPFAAALAALAHLAGCGACADPVAEARKQDRTELTLADLLVTPSPIIVDLGESVEVAVEGRDQHGDPIAIDGDLELEVADDAVATVDDDGTLLGLAVGTTVLTARVGLITTDVNVSVQSPDPPAGLDYRGPYVLTAGGEMVPVAPTSTGGFITSYAVDPALPAGLALDERTGVITGTPTLPQLLAEYTITGTNIAGTIDGVVEIEVRCDQNVRPDPALDLPDDDGLDDNGDGIDGMACGPVFVSPAGRDDGDGTRLDPLLTLAAAVARAEQLEPPRDVYLAAGTYAGPIAVSAAISLVGGFDADFSARTVGARARIEGGATALTLAPEEPGEVALRSIAIVADDAFSAGAGSVGVRVIGAGVLTLHDVDVRAGDGASGMDGIAGDDGNTGGDGGEGAPGCESGLIGVCATCVQPLVGEGVGDGALRGGEGGAPGVGGEDGAFGEDGGDGAFGGLPGSFAGERGGGDGDFGVDGGDGVDGAGGLADQDGAQGGPGTDGTGGGGGGGGAGSDAGCNDYGGAGGGGGRGGTAGTGGTGGTKGGSSFALLVVDTDVVVRGSELVAGDGGRGGRGGDGGLRGSGGFGLIGGDGLDGSGFGGWGGDGGSGGEGGDGGGGGGGSSAAVAVDDAERFTQGEACTLTAGVRGEGGDSFGNAGANGAASALLER